MARVVQAEAAAAARHVLLTPPPPPRHYPWRLLALANQLLEAAGVYVLNPRDLQCTSLLEADADWLTDFYHYRKMLDYERDKRRRPPELQ